ncbi:MAG: outer membrane lipoprotein carrier protein LolA [Proteobacteria bacterium]|nr:MAG: outer membrane lipoprotein carrier protein LolA [Pseudomonadota bacterium]QKK12274.1 MAG: outer membrane lipoprotein chaperone LolA [Pseudomonadota bacterium]
MRLTILMVGVLLTWTVPAAAADDAVASLRVLVEQTRSLKAAFEQSVEDSQSKRILRSSGRLELLRPGRFRWDYQKPYPQQIVADGERIWIYDTELEQVTVKPLSTALGSAPSLLLSGGIELDASFTYQPMGTRDGAEWVELIPKEPDSNFEKVRIGFVKRKLSTMELVDSFGQLTRFRFTEVEVDPPVAAARFQFVPPAGVDVVGQ